ncbi:carbon monoxide dehydrogenase subunit G [Acidiphilium sp. AL]|uniref:Carbon monoxide dehydrogenase subunit G n=1 Tax=Acidiphilium iwatense TaxID=768198 RepID=A0ABS9DV02_9PROT|nr:MULTISPECIES: carbon monoxide dehydrogenase subunit G [Acidiphilium]MCF3946546.1 carbon monoxide dehydrogenase subunit G [Acidiphilium iwatense]MCU4160273.1 carbon monoxide dehydrogenase subunit G [Acidiphilium sp. AL]
MDMSGERLIAAPRETVWVALNDPEILQACIPGCESIEKLSDTEMKAVVNAKIGPISSRFNGRVTLGDLDPPNSYTISGEGQGGVAGFAKGGAQVKLDDEQGATRLHYQVNAQIGGKMAQLGARLIDSVAKSYAETFFTRFVEQVAPTVAQNVPEPVPAADHGHAPAPVHAHGAHEADRSNPVIAGLPIGIWIPLVISIVVVAIVIAKFIG